MTNRECMPARRNNGDDDECAQVAALFNEKAAGIIAHQRLYILVRLNALFT